MRVRFIVSALVAVVGASLLSCGKDSQVDRTVDVSALTFEDVQERSVDAITRHGSVFHLTADEGLGSSEIWIDVERDLARAEYGEHVEVTYNQRHAMAGPDERFSDAPITSHLPRPSLFAAVYLRWLFDDDANDRSLREGEVGGAPAIIAEVTRDQYDYDATETAEVYLDEAFLPLKLDYKSSLARFGSSTTTFQHEFVDASTLPADYFSPEPLKALARTPLDDLTDANDAGVPIYWLGEEFKDVVLEEASFSPDAVDGQPAANYSYAPSDFFIVTPCVHISAYSPGAVSLLRDRLEQDYLGEMWQTYPMEGGTVTLYRGITEPPGGPTIGDSPVDGSSPPEPQPLPDIPEDDGRGRRAIIELDTGGAIEIDARCGPVGTNVYRTDDAFRRLAQSFRPLVPDP